MKKLWLIALALLLGFPIFKKYYISKELYCERDSDCVKAQCCHAKSTINKKYAPDCRGIGCTQECEGPFDCAAPYIPVCVNHRCGIGEDPEPARIIENLERSYEERRRSER